MEEPKRLVAMLAFWALDAPKPEEAVAGAEEPKRLVAMLAFWALDAPKPEKAGIK
jgi:hypothetical protein